MNGRDSNSENRFCEYAPVTAPESMIALARKLQSCGNEVAFIGVPDVEPFAHAASLDFVSFCEKDYPEGSISKGWGSVAKMHGIDVTRCMV